MKYVFLVMVLLFSCNPLKHYQKVATDTKVTTEKKLVIAPWVATHFDPGPPVFIKGKDSVVIDSSYNKPMVDSLSAMLDSLLSSSPTVNIDSLKKEFIKLCAPKTVTITKSRVDTVEKPSSAQAAKIMSLQSDLAIASTQNSIDKVTIADKDSKLNEAIKEVNKAKRNLLIIVIPLILIVLALLYLLFKPKTSLI